MPGAICRKAVIVSQPFMPGMTTSLSTKRISSRCRRNTSTASRPSIALTTVKPSIDSIVLVNSRAIPSSSTSSTMPACRDSRGPDGDVFIPPRFKW